MPNGLVVGLCAVCTIRIPTCMGHLQSLCHLQVSEFLPQTRSSLPTSTPHPGLARALAQAPRENNARTTLLSEKTWLPMLLLRVGMSFFFTRALYISEPLFLSFKHTSKHTHTHHPCLARARAQMPCMQRPTEVVPDDRVSPKQPQYAGFH